MDDSISRQAVINTIEKYDFKSPEYMNYFLTRLKDAIKADLVDDVNAIPSAEVEPVKRGKWIYDNQFHWYRASCSKCGYKRVTDIKAEKWNDWHYCPNCGAKMEPISVRAENG